MKISEITSLLEEFAPLSLQFDWDNSGKQVGNFENQATGALLTLDITEKTIETAIENGANLIISHHPLIFAGLKSITGVTPVERIIMRAICEKIAIYSCHTNIDAADGGVSWAMAQKLQLTNTIAMSENGMGCIGDLSKPFSLEEFAAEVKKQYQLQYVKVNSNAPQRISRVAVIGGSGTSELSQAIALGAEAIVTGDAKYHDFQRAANQIALIDIGHFESEIDVLEIFLKIIQKKYPTFATYTEKISFVETL